MRLPKSEVTRRKTAVLAFFRKNPTTSVAKMNAALTKGELTGKPEKMLNIATGYAWRKEAIEVCACGLKRDEPGHGNPNCDRIGPPDPNAPQATQAVAPPVDNDHVAPGCEQFTPEVIAANRSGSAE